MKGTRIENFGIDVAICTAVNKENIYLQYTSPRLSRGGGAGGHRGHARPKFDKSQIAAKLLIHTHYSLNIKLEALS